MSLRVYTQDEIFNSSIGDDVYLQPDVDRELEIVKNAAHNIIELNNRLTEENLKLQEENLKLQEEIEKLKHGKINRG